jgi:hypothetical protein
VLASSRRLTPPRFRSICLASCCALLPSGAQRHRHRHRHPTQCPQESRTRRLLCRRGVKLRQHHQEEEEALVGASRVRRRGRGARGAGARWRRRRRERKRRRRVVRLECLPPSARWQTQRTRTKRSARRPQVLSLLALLVQKYRY